MAVWYSGDFGMIQEMLPGILRLEVPLPKSPLKATNSYVVLDHDRPLVIDTAFNRPECRAALEGLLVEAGVDLDRVDFFVTHLHADHLGLAPSLARNGTAIYFNEPDMPLARPSDEYWEWMGHVYERHGLPLHDSRIAMDRHPGRIYGPERDFAYTVVRDGDVFHKAGYTLRCFQTIGHTPGHMCLLVEGHRALFCGDHILGDITPNITMWIGMDNPLGHYLWSLDATARLGLEYAFTGHRSIVTDCSARIAQLKDHHAVRCNEVLAALADGEKDAATVTPLISWDLRYERWDDVHPVQKLFATGETIAHLQYLEKLGKVKRRESEGRVLFSLSPV
ncbi:MAG TPA: MBL fold metallo-hydrolase [Dehalococcoidia bacterium]|nr:MBL fold metallo-hydrolase [Dehalococcoidia bacterium]